MIKYIKPDKLFLMVVFIAACILNLQLLDNSNINFALAGHDEYLTIREVYSILNPLSLKHFFMAIISGDVLYYGRIMFYTDALFAWLPFKIFGITGLVYSIRMLHTIMVIVGLAILGKTFLIDWKHRLMFFVATLTLYYSSYFFMVPKPEPIQLLILSLFFYYFKRSKFQFGRHFILLGIAYGIKFNVISLLPLLFILPFFFQADFKDLFKKLFSSLFFFIIGLLIAVPCLIIAPIKPIFFRSYFESTFANTAHTDDDVSVGIIDWLSRGWFGAYNGGNVFGVILVIFILIILCAGFIKLIKNRIISNDFLMVLCGIGLTLPIVFFTKRLWPQYLWTGYIFLMLGILIFIQSETKNKIFKTIYNSAFLLLLAGSIYCSFSQEMNIISLEAKTKTLNENGKKAYNYLQLKNKAFISIQDMSVPYPFKNMVEVKRYHPFASEMPMLNSPNQKFVWSNYISPQIIADNKADYIIVNRLNFADTVINVNTENIKTVIKNNQLMNGIIGKTVFLDTTFGPIKVYKIIK